MEKADMAEYTLTVEEVAKEVGVTTGRIRQLIMEGRIRGIMRAGSWFFKPDVVTNYPRNKRGRRPKQQ